MKYLLIVLLISSASLFSMQEDEQSNKENIRINSTHEIVYNQYYDYPGGAPVTPPSLRKPTREANILLQESRRQTSKVLFGCWNKETF